MDSENRKVWLADQEVEFTSTEFDLLWVLASQAGIVLDRDAIFSSLRGFGYDGLDRSIDVGISRLRKKLNDTSPQPSKIKTVWGKGYLFSNENWN